MPPTILYLDTIPGDPIHALTLAGIRRYAATLGWVAAAVPESETRPEALEDLFREHAPVAGCIVECAGLHAGFPPRLFGETPVVYIDCDPSQFQTPIFCVSQNSFEAGRLAALELNDLGLNSFASPPILVIRQMIYSLTDNLKI